MREPYMLPDDQCERLRRSEMQAVRMMLAVISVAAYAKEDLADRLKSVPYGQERMRLAVGCMKAICDDLIGTVSKSQCKQLYGTAKDFEMRLLPKLTPWSTNIVMTKEEGKALMDCARWKCHSCVEDGDSCRECQLYKVLEATTPMDDYGDGLICPYSMAQWEE